MKAFTAMRKRTTLSSLMCRSRNTQMPILTGQQKLSLLQNNYVICLPLLPNLKKNNGSSAPSNVSQIILVLWADLSVATEVTNSHHRNGSPFACQKKGIRKSKLCGLQFSGECKTNKKHPSSFLRLNIRYHTKGNTSALKSWFRLLIQACSF